MHYRRSWTPGGTYFFTVVTFARRPFLCHPDNVTLLREAFRVVKRAHPFAIDALVLLPDHLHCIWTLPAYNHDFATRWMLIKSYFTRHCAAAWKTVPSASRQRKHEQSLWQRRYWEHQIRDELDFERHCDYIHYNPVKHGYVKRPADCPIRLFNGTRSEGFIHWTGVLGASNLDRILVGNEHRVGQRCAFAQPTLAEGAKPNNSLC